ncbi:MAG: TonB-dependent receptor plug domain-containing protein [Methylococcaceae bacterium]|nr:TonB-dependent receptor plug domain-containing protein [Methylococcaceae bacterium]
MISRPAADTGIGGGDSFMLRGFDSFPASVYRDGMRLVFSGQTDLAAIERVEVLKGPAAILYGRIEPGGLINQVGKQPLANPFYALQQQFGSFDFYRTTLDATGPINSEKSLKYRFNLAFETANSFQEFINNERVVAAPVLRWDISPATQVTLELNYRHSMDPLSPGIPFIGNRPAPVPRERNFGESTHTLRGTDDIYTGINWSHAFNENWSFNHRFYIDRTNRFQQANVFLNSGVLNAGDLIERSGEEPEGDSGSTDYFTTYNLTGHFNTGLFQHTVLLGGDYYQNQNDPGKGVGFAIPPTDVFQPVHDDVSTLFRTQG